MENGAYREGALRKLRNLVSRFQSLVFLNERSQVNTCIYQIYFVLASDLRGGGGGSTTFFQFQEALDGNIYFQNLQPISLRWHKQPFISVPLEPSFFGIHPL